MSDDELAQKIAQAAALLDKMAEAWERQHTFPGSTNTKHAADCREMAKKLRGGEFVGVHEDQDDPDYKEDIAKLRGETTSEIGTLLERLRVPCATQDSKDAADEIERLQRHYNGVVTDTAAFLAALPERIYRINDAAFPNADPPEKIAADCRAMAERLRGRDGAAG